jgi:hypothetical protein
MMPEEEMKVTPPSRKDGSGFQPIRSPAAKPGGKLRSKYDPAPQPAAQIPFQLAAGVFESQHKQQ